MVGEFGLKVFPVKVKRAKRANKAEKRAGEGTQPAGKALTRAEKKAAKKVQKAADLQAALLAKKEQEEAESGLAKAAEMALHPKNGEEKAGPTG